MFERGKKDEFDKADGPAAGGSQTSFGGTAPAGTSRAKADAGAGSAAVIGRSIHIDGDLRGEEDLRIEGEVNGTIHLKSNSLTIGSEGKISADIYAQAITVDGVMEGDLYASERVEVRQNAKVVGNITSPRVSLEDGAKFKGSIEMDQEAVDAALGKSRGPARQPTSIDQAGKAGDDKTPAAAPAASNGTSSTQKGSAV